MQITAGKYCSQKLLSLKKLNARPTLSKIRSAVFNVLNSMIEEDFSTLSFLDLFAGSGIMGFEALSRGFLKNVSIEKNKENFKVIQQNYLKLKLTPNVFLSDSLTFLKKTNEKFDVIYIDPPYESSYYEDCLNLIFKNNVLSENGIIVLEHKKDKQFNLDNFKIIKIKQYSEIVLTFVCYSNNENF